MHRHLTLCVVLLLPQLVHGQRFFEFTERGRGEFGKFIISVSERDWKNIGVNCSRNDTSFYTNNHFRHSYSGKRISYAPTTFEERVDFGYITINDSIRYFDFESEPIIPDYRVFRDGLRMASAHLKNFDVSGGTFERSLLIDHCKIDSGSNFSTTSVGEVAFFEGNHFLQGIYFSKNRFLGQTRFENNTDLGTLPSRFFDVSFQGPTFFTNQEFRRVQFYGSQFNNLITSFSNVRFDEVASFDNCTFLSGKVFAGVYLPDSLYFNDVNFKMPSGELFDFRNTFYDNNRTSDGRCVIFLTNTDASRLLLPEDRFRLGGLSSDGFHIDSRDVIYDERYITLLESLIKNCREAGMIESAEGWDIVLKKINNINTWGRDGGRFLNTVNRYWWNYGYAKRYILWGWLPGFFMFFLILNFFVSKWINSFYKDDELGKNFGLSSDDPENHKSFTYIFFLTAVLYFGLKIKHSAVDYRNTGGVLYLYLLYMIGSLHVAFALSYILNIY